MIHYYIYYKKDGRVFYERTCGTKESADARVKELKERGHGACGGKPT
jgi:hypothetical protein